MLRYTHRGSEGLSVLAVLVTVRLEHSKIGTGTQTLDDSHLALQSERSATSEKTA